MPLITTVSPENATGELAQIYENIQALRGRVAHSAQLFSASPELLKQQLSFIKHYINHPKLSPSLCACIRMLVSDKNSCAYCIDFNASLLINLFKWLPKEIEAMRANPKEAKLEEHEKAMLLFVLKAIRTPHDINASDVEALRILGYNDGDILDATNLGARMSAIDIIFDAFKIKKDF